MGRKKQARPHRSVGVIGSNDASEKEVNDKNASQTKKEDVTGIDTAFYVEVDCTNWVSDEHLDVSEILLTNLNLSTEFYGYNLDEEFYRYSSKYHLRFRLNSVNEFIGHIKLGHWPALSARRICLEFVEKRQLEVEDQAPQEMHVVMVSGSFDGPDEGVSGLVHLANLKFLTLRPILGVTFSENVPSLRLRVEILSRAFNSCKSLLDNTRQLWKKSMMNVMAWLRPEVTTSEARYGYSVPVNMGVDLPIEPDAVPSAKKKKSSFDATGFYEAIKPSKDDPVLDDDIPDLLPELRPYQRRAVYWMVQREKGINRAESSQTCSPLCMPVNLIGRCSRIFYNPFSGNISLLPDKSMSYVFGGILADEMGLGKTVELLACIFTHKRSASEVGNYLENVKKFAVDQKINLKRLKRERVECICGAVTESSNYKGLWVQCDICDAWQHGNCVGYSARGKRSKTREVAYGQRWMKNPQDNLQKHSKKKDGTNVEIMDDDHICQLCLELMQATDPPIATGATLVVCPAPILPQWHAEIIRHTRPGSLKTCIYEGVRNTSLSNMSMIDIGEMVNADIVLTTYDVLKEDLSHDSDRHEGDRRLMRFQKRYPVIPTLLTRIFWWRVCLDEAQMVESNAAAATEMALRLHAKHRWCITGTPIQRKLDDLYGLLRFLEATPFDVLRWWIEVMRDPYEQGDVGAMTFTQNFFKQIMWRTAKVHVVEELQLPPQEECLSWLSLSPIEVHFYQRQHETCVNYAREVIENFKYDILKREVTGSGSSNFPSDPFITHVEAGKLLNSLLKLRQACCHPQVGSSGLRSLQQSPMTMEEILQVLVAKTKVEGEEALRRAVVALNGLAGIAILMQNFPGAVALYKEALTLAEEHAEDFRLDPLLNIHIHHNLVELLPSTLDHLPQSWVSEKLPGTAKAKILEVYDEEWDQHAMKRKKVDGEVSLDNGVSAQRLSEFHSNAIASGVDCKGSCELDPCILSRCSSDQFLRMICESLKRKFLTGFYSRLSSAQQEFKKSFCQVSSALADRKNQYTSWWLEALDHVEQNKESSYDLIRKIGDAVSGTLNTSRTSRIASCFQSITALKYYIQTGLDELENSRKTLLDRLLEIDQTMENPREGDIETVRYCPNCNTNGDGPICVNCELDELFQVYEVRLFRLNKGNKGGLIASAEEAVDLQKRKSALNRFFWTLSQPDKYSSSLGASNEDDGKKRDVGEKVMVSKSPSEVEIILGIIKTHSKAFLGREDLAFGTKQISLIEAMRKEYGHARSLATAQAQVLRAHDEVKMATSRLRLREEENDKSIDALSLVELDAASAENSSEKFLALASLLRVRGQLRYLKGLVESKQNLRSESPLDASIPDVTAVSLNSKTAVEHKFEVKADEEACPICHEKLSNQKMVFQCGHVTCCKCLFAMTEQRLANHGKFQDKWVMCPTCRQHTDFRNIAFVDDKHRKSCNSSIQGSKSSEAFIHVHGSYSTKIEAITRRILWIKATDRKAKILVFSSWNDVLDVLEHAFAANCISCIRMKGGRKSQDAISHFKGEKGNLKGSDKIHNRQPETNSVQVLLLLIQHGANGLNLLEAQHVILVEPLLNPAAEAQAISRVHRIGQENKTFVHRFIVKDTVEESIYKLKKSRDAGSYISGNTKNQDQPVLTLKDVESLFKVSPSELAESDKKSAGSLMHLPPSMAAVVAAERRLMENTA